ncbi:MAG: hypothetical protein MJZ95_00825 [Paludibacteraceae bacterium]|nr:hypothetical protein [Paludibacteraceae bacterium]
MTNSENINNGRHHAILTIVMLIFSLTTSAQYSYTHKFDNKGNWSGISEGGVGWTIRTITREETETYPGTYLRMILAKDEDEGPSTGSNFYATLQQNLETGKYTVRCKYHVFFPSYSGVNDQDFVRIALIPDSETLPQSNNFTSTNLPNSWISLDGDQALINEESQEWSTLEKTFEVKTQGTYKLAIAFQYNGAHEPEEGGILYAVIDSISIKCDIKYLNTHTENGNTYLLCHQYKDSSNYAILIQSTADSVETREVTIVDTPTANPINLTNYTSYNIQVTLPETITDNSVTYTVKEMKDTALARLAKCPTRLNIQSSMTALPIRAFAGRNCLIVHKSSSAPTFDSPITQNIELKPSDHVSIPYLAKCNGTEYTQRPFGNHKMKLKVVHKGPLNRRYIMHWKSPLGFDETVLTDTTFEGKLTDETVVEGTLGYDEIIRHYARISVSTSTQFSDSLRYLVFETDTNSLPSYVITGTRELTLPKESKSRLDLKINNTRYFHFSLPFNSQMSDLTIKAYKADGSETEIRYSATRPEYIQDDIHNFYSIFCFSEEERAKSTTLGNSYIPLDTSATIEKGKGYLVAIYEGAENPATHATLSFLSEKGVTLHSTASTVEIPTSFTSGQPAYRSGWNLIGNPFTFDIKGNNLPKRLFAKVDFDNGETNKNKITHYDIETYPHDAFTFQPFSTIFIQTNGTKLVLGPISQQAPVACMRDDIPDHIEITITDKMGNDSHTNIVHKPEASTHYVIGEDLAYLGSTTTTTLSSMSDSVRCAFNKQMIDSTGKAIDLHLVTDHEGNYTFSINENRTQWNGKILLHDNEANILKDITNDSYTVHLKEGTFDSRFSLLITHHETIVGEETIADDNAVVFTTNEGNIVLANLPATPLHIQLSTITGQTICTMTADNESEVTIPHNLLPQNSLLILTLRTTSGTKSWKVMTH